MRLLLAAALLYPGLLESQDSVRRDASALEEWRLGQVALAEASAVERSKRREDGERALEDLGRHAERLRMANRDWLYALQSSLPRDRFATVSEFTRLDPDSLVAHHAERRDRFAENDSSGMALDAVRRAGDVDLLLGALERRSHAVQEFLAVANALALDAEALAAWADEWRQKLMLENRPEADDEVKLRL